MKKFVMLVLISIAFVGWFPATASYVPSQPTQTEETSYDSEVIDGIKVPLDIIMYAQLKYQGWAITKASRTMHDGKKAYSLRVDRDSDSTDYKSLYLIYSTKWKLLKVQKMEPPVVAPTPEHEEEEVSAPDNRSTVENPAPKPRSTNNNGSGSTNNGSGGDQTPTTETPPPSGDTPTDTTQTTP